MNTARLLRNRLRSQEIRFYHAGLTREEKKRLETWFLNSENGILCATCAYGMGVDKPNIRTVIHLSPPSSVEAYLQESGRASRDGKGANAWLIWRMETESKLEESAERDYPTRERGQKLAETKNPEEDMQGEDFMGKANHPLTILQRVSIDSRAVTRLRRERMITYASSIHTCRRTILLASLGIDSQDCSGCDVCGGQPLTNPHEEKLIIRAVKWNRLRFSRGKMSRILMGRRSAEILRSGLHFAFGFGALSGWELEDVEEAITTLIHMKKIKVRRHWPAKGRLY